MGLPSHSYGMSLAIWCHVDDVVQYIVIKLDSLAYTGWLHYLAESVAEPFSWAYKKLSYCWETVRRKSMPRIAEMDVEMTT